MGMKKPATDKQIDFAHKIAYALGIPYPAEETRQSLFLFIRDNKPKYDELMDVAYPICEGMYDPSDFGLDPYTGGFADND